MFLKCILQYCKNQTNFLFYKCPKNQYFVCTTHLFHIKNTFISLTVQKSFLQKKIFFV